MLLAKVHFGSKSAVRLPHARGARRGLLEHLIDLLEGKTLGLGNKEEGEEEGDAAQAAPHEEDVGAETGRVVTIGHEVWGDDTDDAVPEPVGIISVSSRQKTVKDVPVGGGGQTDTSRADGKGENFANHNPRSRTPGCGKDGDVQANEGDHGAGRIRIGWVIGRVFASSGTNGTDDELHDDHTGGTPDENGTTTDLLDHNEGGRRREHVDQGGNERNQEGVLDGSELLKEDRATFQC